MMKTLLQTLLLLTLTLLINACDQSPCTRECDENGQHCQKECSNKSDATSWFDDTFHVDQTKRCVEADDWGYPKVWVPASGRNPSPRGDHNGGQVSLPEDSGQVLIDVEKIPLVITIGKSDRWTSWFGGEINNLSEYDGYDGGQIVPNLECEYQVLNGASPGGITDDLSPATIFAEQNNCSATFTSENPRYNKRPLYANCKTPCYFKYGMGLYVGLAPDNGMNSTSPEDVIFAYHIPDAQSPDISQNLSAGSLKDRIADREARGLDGYLVKGYAKDELPGAANNDRLFFKIVDHFYEDNDGGYYVQIKEGTRSTKPGPLELVTGALIGPVKIIMERLYKTIINNQGYVQAVRGVLAIYIIFYAFVFMIGGVEEAKKGVVMRILKIALIVQLISPDSWDFFYNNLFQIFFEGIMEISALLMSPFQNYDPAQPWYSMDQLLLMLFSAETNAKIMSTLFSNSIGFIAVIFLYGAIIIFLLAALKAVVIYVLAFIAMAILVVLAPIFIIFILFEKTKDLFIDWLDQFVAYSIQLIILLAALGMFSAMIIMFMQKTIGYTVCWNVWWDLDLFHDPSFHIASFRHWMPDISPEMGNLWMDANNDGIRGLTERAYRYVDIPYLDPIYDRDLVAKYLSNTNFLSIGDLLIFFASIFFMYSFMKFIPIMSNSIKGGGSGKEESSSIFGASGALLQTIVSTGAQALSGIFRTGGEIKEAKDRIASSSKSGLIRDAIIDPLQRTKLYKSGAETYRSIKRRAKLLPGDTLYAAGKGVNRLRGRRSTGADQGAEQSSGVAGIQSTGDKHQGTPHDPGAIGGEKRLFDPKTGADLGSKTFTYSPKELSGKPPPGGGAIGTPAGAAGTTGGTHTGAAAAGTPTAAAGTPTGAAAAGTPTGAAGTHTEAADRTHIAAAEAGGTTDDSERAKADELKVQNAIKQATIDNALSLIKTGGDRTQIEDSIYALKKITESSPEKASVIQDYIRQLDEKLTQLKDKLEDK